MSEYSFCESIYASGSSRWHIRKLTKVGPKYSGGIDTYSLCDAVKTGWDVNCPMKNLDTLIRSNGVCLVCLERYRKAIA